jgi:hypothetical protein
MSSIRSPKWIVFIALMAALGNAMFVISQTIFKVGQIALDLSHIGTFIAAIFGGPWIGLVTGLLVGIGPGLYFGYLGGTLGLLGLIGLPVGKALTGLTTGYLTRILKIGSARYSSWKVVPATLLGYVPESVFTVFFFKGLVTIWLPQAAPFLAADAFVLALLAKAWIEIGIMGFVMGALIGNNGFSNFMRQHFTQIAGRRTQKI